MTTRTVHFTGGPRDGQTIKVDIAEGMYLPANAYGEHYKLGPERDPVTYHWDGTPCITVQVIPEMDEQATAAMVDKLADAIYEKLMDRINQVARTAAAYGRDE